MKLVSLIILAAIVGGIAYVLVFQRDWLFKKGGEVVLSAQGYTAAKTPRDAMEKFVKAVKERNYNAAAVYCTNEYADKLKKAHTAAKALGSEIDTVSSYVDEKGFRNDKTTFLLRALDPFPTNIKIGKVEDAKDKTPAFGIFVLEPLPAFDNPAAIVNMQQEVSGLDPKMFVLYSHALGIAVGTPIELKNEGEGDNKAWRIDYKVPPVQHDGIEYLIGHYKCYVEGLNTFRDEVRQGRHLKDALAGELLRVFGSCK